MGEFKRWITAVKRIAWSLVRVTTAVLVVFPVVLYFYQEKLLFYPDPINEDNRKAIQQRYRYVEEVTLAAPDGKKLHGWFQRSSSRARAPLLIYFGGNAEDISFLPAAADRIRGWSLLAMSYRGYGLSEGVPGQEAMLRDALDIYDSFSRRPHVDPERVAVMGRSLGSGVAAHLAAHRPVRAVVLTTPYDSVTSVASEKYWFVPVSLIIRHPFDSLALAPKIDKPVLFIVAGEDTTIPPRHARRLFEAWAGPKQWHLVNGENHETVDLGFDYWRLIGDFLNGASALDPAPAVSGR